MTVAVAIKLCAAAVLTAAAIAVSAEAQTIEIRRVSDGSVVDGAAGLADLAAGYDFVLMGEIHDNPAHQALQSEVAAALQPPAMAFEMVPEAREAALADLRAAEAADDALREAAHWDAYAPYHVVLEAAPNAVVTGAGRSRAQLNAAVMDGAAAAFGDEAARFGLDVPWPEDVQEEVELEMQVSHCNALPPEMLPGMAEAQRLRDAAFAAALLRAYDRAERGPALLITGNGHLRRDRAVPLFLSRVAPERSVLVIAVLERRDGDAGWRDALARWDGAGADVVAITPEAERDDPCADFAPPKRD